MLFCKKYLCFRFRKYSHHISDYNLKYYNNANILGFEDLTLDPGYQYAMVIMGSFCFGALTAFLYGIQTICINLP